MRKVTILLSNLFLICFFAGKADAQNNWKRVYNDANLNAIDFLDSNIGIAVGYNEFIVTTSDGGKTWTTRNTNIVNSPLRGVKFAAAGIAVAVSHDGNIIRTTDNGITWTQLSSPARQYWAITFNKTGIGISVGDSGTVIRSTDFGMTWNKIAPITMARLSSITFADDSVALAVSNGGEIFRSNTSGLTWSKISYISPSGLNGISFCDHDHGYIAGDKEILFTTDGGLNWIKTTTSLSYGYSVVCHNPGSAYVGGGNSNIYYTSDTGKTWKIYADNFETLIKGIVFPDSLHGFAVGSNEILSLQSGNLSALESPEENAFMINTYPNPFSEKMKVSFYLSAPSFVHLHIINIAGIEIENLFTGFAQAGNQTFQWDGQVSSGVYYVILENNRGMIRKTITLIH